MSQELATTTYTMDNPSASAGESSAASAGGSAAVGGAGEGEVAAASKPTKLWNFSNRKTPRSIGRKGQKNSKTWRLFSGAPAGSAAPAAAAATTTATAVDPPPPPQDAATLPGKSRAGGQEPWMLKRSINRLSNKLTKEQAKHKATKDESVKGI